MSRTNMASKVWEESILGSNSIDVHIRNLRQKLTHKKSKNDLTNKELIIVNEFYKDQLKKTQFFEEQKKGMLHDIASPLSALTLMLENSYTDKTLLNKQKIQSLLDITYQINQIINPKEKPIFVDSLIKRIQNSVQPKLDDKDISLKYIPKCKFSVKSPINLHRAIQNIVENAIESFEKQNTSNSIKIITNLSHNMFTVSISNNGEPIKSEIKDIIFDNAISTKSENRGQGLAITREIVQKIYKGQVQLDYSNLNETRFTIYLPIKYNM